MFEKIVIRRHETSGRAIDPGLLAETLLFYEHVHLLLDATGLTSLLNTIGADTLITLLQEGLITVTQLEDGLATITNTSDNGAFHNFAAFMISTRPGERKFDKRESLLSTFERTLGKSPGTHKKWKHYLRHVKFRKHRARASPSIDVVEMARSDIEDANYVRAAVEIILRGSVPGLQLPTGWFFAVNRRPTDFTVTSNLDLAAINRQYHKYVPPTENSVTNAWLLSNMLDARADLFFSADYMSEFVTDPIHSDIAKLRFADLMRRRSANAADINVFQDVILDNAHAIREAINSGQRSFAEFLRLLEKARKFKVWLRKASPDANLLREYTTAATEGTWIQSLPVKGLRFAVCTVTGLLAPVAGVAFGAADTFFSERLLGGWKPSQFVQGHLSTFVNPENSERRQI